MALHGASQVRLVPNTFCPKEAGTSQAHPSLGTANLSLSHGGWQSLGHAQLGNGEIVFVTRRMALTYATSAKLGQVKVCHEEDVSFLSIPR